jgi:hypothetical protein
LVGGFNEEVGREDIFKSIIGKKSLYKVSNDDRVKVRKFTNLELMNENVNLLADPNSVFSSWKNFFSGVLNVHAIHHVGQRIYIRLSQQGQNL